MNVFLLCFIASFKIMHHGCVEAALESSVEAVPEYDDFFYNDTLVPEQEEVRGAPTYIPGLLTVEQSGLTLSAGLTARVIATTGQPVRLVNGQTSQDIFHKFPDGAAVFELSEGWAYVSNAEAMRGGGVGAIYFNSDGEVIDYKILLRGTRLNCGGGKTFWGTWLSCEELPKGQIYEVDPTKVGGRKTLIGGLNGNFYESVAYDNRDTSNPTFYVTVDSAVGALVRFTPDKAALSHALDTGDYSNLLHSNSSGTAQIDYLVMRPNEGTEDAGTFRWTRDHRRAKKSARRFYPYTEGLDARNGKLYMTAKYVQQLFIIDLDAQTYERSSTIAGAFSNEPDQIRSILGSDGGILYFCEDGGYSCGVHGRDSDGSFFTIVQGDEYNDLFGETTGLAFAPNHKCFYVSFQDFGKIVEVCREDGYKFGGQRLDIRYHPR